MPANLTPEYKKAEEEYRKATTLDEIAEKSEFGKGTIYNYFSSKEEIYKEIVSSILKTNKQNFLEAEKTSETLYDLILETTKRQISFCQKNKDAFLLLVYTKMHHAKSTSLEVSKMMKDNEDEMIKHNVLIDSIAQAQKLGLEAIDSIKDDDNVDLKNIMSQMINREF